MRELTQEFVDLLTEWEGCKLEMYKDSAGYATIGIGHLLTKSELSSGKVNAGRFTYVWGTGMSRLAVQDLLRHDLRRYKATVEDKVSIFLNQHEYEALVSFCFNVGRSAFASSTLVRKLNMGDFQSAPREFRRWVYAGGQKSKGLANRREKEITHFLNACDNI